MKVVIAPDSFKGSLSAIEVANSIEKGIKKVDKNIETVKIPMADGGEGTVEALVEATGGKYISVKVRDPLMREIEAVYGILGDNNTAVIEMAQASGLPLLKKEERNPMRTTTYGTGELIKHAIDNGCENIIIGIGGSATNDGGAGMAMALGAKLLNEEGNSIALGAEGLINLKTIDLEGFDKKISQCNFIAACDVENPLIGKDGASYIFAPQKGADENMVEILDEYLEHYGIILEKKLGISILQCKGSGAAGGLGAALLAFLNAKFSRGIDIVIETVELEEKIKDADLVITGEGMIDYQTQFGKAPFGVATISKKHDKSVIAIAGGIGDKAFELYGKGIDSIFSIVDKPMSLEEAMENGKELLEQTSERIIRLLRLSK